LRERRDEDQAVGFGPDECDGTTEVESRESRLVIANGDHQEEIVISLYTMKVA
jgi:hypothetical protein